MSDSSKMKFKCHNMVIIMILKLGTQMMTCSWGGRSYGSREVVPLLQQMVFDPEVLTIATFYLRKMEREN